MPPESAPSIGAQTRVSLALIDTSEDIPLSGLPTLLGGFVEIGCSRDIRLKFPSQPSKPIPCGLVAAQWMVPGREELGNLDVQSLDFAEVPDDILSYNNKRTVARLETVNEEDDIVRRIDCVDWRPVIEMSFPDGDGETTVSATGPYSRIIVDNSP
jgi:hypothetical protein